MEKYGVGESEGKGGDMNTNKTKKRVEKINRLRSKQKEEKPGSRKGLRDKSRPTRGFKSPWSSRGTGKLH